MPSDGRTHHYLAKNSNLNLIKPQVQLPIYRIYIQETLIKSTKCRLWENYTKNPVSSTIKLQGEKKEMEGKPIC